MCRLIAPMLAAAGAPPDNAEQRWSFEMTYDGCRVLASVGGGGREPELWTRNLNPATSSYPEIAEALSTAFGDRGRLVLGGAIVASIVGCRPSACSSAGWASLVRRSHCNGEYR